MPDNWYFNALNEEWNKEQTVMIPTGQEVEAVARAMATCLAEQDGDYSREEVFPHGVLKWPWIDQGEVDFSRCARAAIAALDQVRGK